MPLFLFFVINCWGTQGATILIKPVVLHFFPSAISALSKAKYSWGWHNSNATSRLYIMNSRQPQTTIMRFAILGEFALSWIFEQMDKTIEVKTMLLDVHDTIEINWSYFASVYVTGILSTVWFNSTCIKE